MNYNMDGQTEQFVSPLTFPVLFVYREKIYFVLKDFVKTLFTIAHPGPSVSPFERCVLVPTTLCAVGESYIVLQITLT